MNKAVFAGRLGRDAELSFFENGNARSRTALAVDRSYKKDGETIKQTDWIPVVVYGKRAEALNEHLTKGKFVIMSGSIRTWSTGEGEERRSGWELAMDELTFGPSSNGNGGGGEHGGSTTSAPRQAASTRGRRSEESGNDEAPW